MKDLREGIAQLRGEVHSVISKTRYNEKQPGNASTC
jgi:hypothetical protein